MCREQLGQALRVYSQEVPLAQARQINGLRAVFGEVRTPCDQLATLCRRRGREVRALTHAVCGWCPRARRWMASCRGA